MVSVAVLFAAVAGLAGSVGGTILAGLAPTPARAANFTLNPTSGFAGSSFTASGDGYTNCFKDWFVVWDSPHTEYGHSGTPTSDPPDIRSTPVVVPLGSLFGTHTVTANCDTGDGIQVERATFTVISSGPPPPPPTTTTTTPPPTTRLSTTTTRPTTTTTTPPTSVPATPVPTSPATTITRPSTSTSTSSSTSTSTTTTTRPPPPSTTIPAPGPSLVAVSTGDTPSGPPGVGLTISGSGYRGCDEVYFFLGGRRIGSATPDAAGTVKRSGYSVPGDLATGREQVQSSCDRSGKPVRQTTTFVVTAASVHRAALLTSLPQPRDVTLDPKRIAQSAVIAVGFVFLLAFPCQLFNSTFEENYDEVRGWFRLRPKEEDYEPRHQGLLYAAFLVVGGVLYALLSPDFGLNKTTVVVAVGLALAILVTGVGFALPGFLYMRSRTGERGRLRVLSGSIVVAALTVLISRAVGFTPGYVYGLLAVFLFRATLDHREEGRLAAGTAVVIVVLCLAAWAARVPVSAAASRPHPSVVILILESALGGIFLLGLESLLVDMIPLRFLDGSRIQAWSKVAWGVLFGIGAFLLVHVLLVPGSGYVGKSEDTGIKVVVVVMYVLFALVSVAFWAYFRYRAERLEPISQSSRSG